GAARGRLPNTRAARPRALAVPAARRRPQLPDVPTLNELGFSGMEDYPGVGMFAPASTPPEIAQKLNDAVLRAVKSPDIKDRLDTLAFEPTASSLKDTANYVRDEVAKWGKIVRETGAKAE